MRPPLAWLFTRRLVRPIRAFAETAEAAGRGDPDAAFAQTVRDGSKPDANRVLRRTLRTAAGRAVHDLFTARSLEAADAAIAKLPASSLRFIDAISPARHIGGIRADVYLMHETEDHHVPFVESRALASACERAGLLRAHTEFRLFDHVQPDDLDLAAAAPELWKLLLHLRTLMEETL